MTVNKPVYLDYNATTPLDPRALELMLPYYKEEFGNPSSKSHPYGWEADNAVKKARKQVAELINASSNEIFFTSGATESNNMSIIGVVKNFLGQRPHLITSSTEHKAVLDVSKMATKEYGAELTVLPVDDYGRTQIDQLEEQIKPQTRLVSIMMANNEIGTINPIKEIGDLCKSRGVFFHVDAAQALESSP